MEFIFACMLYFLCQSTVRSTNLRPRGIFTHLPAVSDETISTSILGYKSKEPYLADLKCSSNCLVLPGCASYLYNTSTGQCIFYTVLHLKRTPGLRPPAMRHFYPIGVSREAPWCPEERGFQLLGANGPCVLFSDDTKSWEEANTTTCPSYGPTGRLVVLDTEEKSGLFKAAGKSINDIFSDGIHIGLTLSGWVNGRPVTFNDGVVDRQLTPDKPCGAVGRNMDWQWVGVPPGRVHHYVCEISQY